MPCSPKTQTLSDDDCGKLLAVEPTLQWARFADVSKEELDRQYPWSKVSDETSFEGAVGDSKGFQRPQELE
jgi:hypothetical protein